MPHENDEELVIELCVKDKKGNIVRNCPTGVEVLQTLGRPLESESDLTKLADNFESAQSSVLQTFNNAVYEILRERIGTGTALSDNSTIAEGHKNAAELPAKLKKKTKGSDTQL